MKNVAVCVLALAAIFIGAVYARVKPKEFLSQYGYLKKMNGPQRAERPTPEELRKALLLFQEFNGLPMTGILDEISLKKMGAPRCGAKDIEGYRTMTKWLTTSLTWKVNKYSRTTQLSKIQQRRAMRRAFKRWADVTPLVFREGTEKPNIAISFEKRDHGDGYPFDGKGHILAHAYAPRNGATHFDDDENWVSGKIRGIDLETVAAHEFGHALGLGHSSEKKALMAPYYRTFPKSFKLHQDDVAGIQSLYGKKPTRRTTDTPRPTAKTPLIVDGFCSYSYRYIDAAMRISANDFVFVDNGTVIDGRNGKKMALQRLFPGGPNSIQTAVYSRQNEKAYLFYNEKIWAYTLNDNGIFCLVKNFPKRISNKRIYSPDSAIRLRSEKIFLLKKGYFYEFMLENEEVDPGWGYKARAFFFNLPKQIDATITDDKFLYFIVNNKAYKMAFRNRRVNVRGKPAKLVFQKCQN